MVDFNYSIVKFRDVLGKSMVKYFQTNPLHSPTEPGNYYEETSVRITCPKRVSNKSLPEARHILPAR